MKVAVVVVLDAKEVQDAVKHAAESSAAKESGGKMVGGCRVLLQPDGSAVVRFGSNVEDAEGRVNTPDENEKAGCRSCRHP